MADTKISEMTAAVTAADADLVPIVQGGVNKKATVDLILDALTAARVATAIGSTAANLVYAGPASGASAVPAARSLVPDDIPSLSAVYLPIGGGTLTGALVLSGAPTIDLHAATKLYVDGLIAALNASNLTSGTVPDARFPATLPALNGSALTALNASNLASGTLDSARLPTVPTTKGGTGLTAIGTALQVLRVNAGATGLEFADAAGGLTGIVSDAATNTVSDALVIQHATSGTAAAGFGTGFLFQGENDIGVMHDMLSLDAKWVNAGDGAELADLTLYATAYGAAKADGLTLSAAVRGTNPGIHTKTTGMRLEAAGEFIIATDNSGSDIVFANYQTSNFWVVKGATGHFAPFTTNVFDIGTPTELVRKIHAATNGVQTANGAQSNVKTISESITLSTGGLTTDSTADLLPANSIILSVVARITTTITTTTDWALGDATTAARFAAPNATLTAGTTSVGLAHQQGSVATDAAGPVQIAAAKLRITCSGANPGAGAVRVTVTYLELTPPTS